MSHELRTPLTSILGFTRLAAEQPDLTGVLRGYIDRVADASGALLCTVNDILDFSKVEAGQVTIRPEPFSPWRLGRSTLDLFLPQAAAKDIALLFDCDLDEDAAVLADPDRVRQILLNLVGNAVKFTAEGQVTLRLRVADGALLTDVSDTGEGIAPEAAARLFRRFSQVDGSSTRAHTGTGLGLAICKGLAEAMGGDIGVDSTPGVGSRFWFSIPAPPARIAQVAAAAESDAHASPSAIVRGARILVADDHPANRELARMFLGAIGAEVTEAVDGADAVAQAMAWPFDVILMDMRMPRMSGAEAAAVIRAGGPNDGTPILAYTANADDYGEDHFLEAGFDGVVAKPLDANALIATIVAALTPESPAYGDARRMASERLPIRVFVADDDPMILQLLRTRLDVAGYHTAGARDGLQAIQAIPDFKPHALVLDINMPHLDGYGVLRALRGRVETRSIPVLVLTARHGADDVQAAIGLGAKDFLAKPFKDADLLARVSRLLRRRAPAAPSQDVFL